MLAFFAVLVSGVMPTPVLGMDGCVDQNCETCEEYPVWEGVCKFPDGQGIDCWDFGCEFHSWCQLGTWYGQCSCEACESR